MKSALGAVACAIGLTMVAPAWGDISAVVAIEPTARKNGLMLSRFGMEEQLQKLLNQQVTVTTTEDLTDAMRATRSGGYDVFIAPAQVAASALAHGYELVGSTDPSEHYLLVGREQLASTADMRKGRIYLPQQDSIYTYMARGMLTSSGLSFKDLRIVEFARYPQAGLTAVSLGLSDATVIRRGEWDAWSRENPGVAKVLASSGAVPGGFSVAVKKDLPADVRSKVAKWFATSAQSAGLKPVIQHAELAQYKAVAQLGTFTPTHLPGATVVTAADVQQLLAKGAVVVDTRNEKEFRSKQIPGAVFVPYHEKSLKDVAYDAKLDDFAGLDKLDSAKPTIFHCNGAECWKSYKASRAAIAKGFKQVYWFRGGLPEWESAGMQIMRDVQVAKR
ncbi:PhnD/SsuA/transferrin family substrate-binding protein [Aquincola sp. S2]|uniref:PhnD/SsuA/transferrin family substrate-binding protein n=1 Tax=Pseudaquabacterium terrae TaxID=2732868 RepID=A0ABX2EIU5_9BURK|nr:rhodanese-like domain-containing protein [Aquabacterium terrae]NRF68556.1 PhnD/SsuA/transferrin family substrate-binding protein [Aquabacterium terrae]